MDLLFAEFLRQVFKCHEFMGKILRGIQGLAFSFNHSVILVVTTPAITVHYHNPGDGLVDNNIRAAE